MVVLAMLGPNRSSIVVVALLLGLFGFLFTPGEPGGR
jgi:hypothetical protein